MSLSDYLVTDDLTVLLGFIGVSVFLLQNLYKPQPLVHPILLGRQSDVGRVRHPTESAVYRNYGTGLMGRVRRRIDLCRQSFHAFLQFPVRPDKDVDLVNDFVKSQFESSRTLWSTKVSDPIPQVTSFRLRVPCRSPMPDLTSALLPSVLALLRFSLQSPVFCCF